ncbi:MAG TPA: HAD family hydrolase [Spirochaetia bacterium]|nr:HAD family hydrolase [Spirochaetia bacterium]
MGQFQSIRNVFLDAGGVILDEEDHERTHAEIISLLIRSVRPHYSPEQYWLDVEEAVTCFAPSVYNYVLWKNTGEVPLYNALKAEHRTQFSNRRPALKPMNGLEKVVVNLAARYRLGILGQYRDELKTVLSGIGVLRYFSFQSTQDGHSFTKPDPRYFEQILKEGEVVPSVSLMVGDRIDKDVIPAKMVGMMTVRLATGLHRNQHPRTPDEFPDAEVHQLEELLDILHP